MEKYLTTRNITVVAILIVLFVVYNLFTSYNNFNTVVVDIRALPEDSKLHINGSEVSEGNNRLNIGDYTFKAVKDGYKDDEYKLAIREDTQVRLLPIPVNEESEDYFKDEKTQQLRESYGGIRASLLGIKDRQKFPITKDIPVDYFEYLGSYGPFSIDYGFNDNDDLFIIIDNSSPNGRVNAQRWFAENNYDPADYEIKYNDFVNPLKTQEVSN